MRKITLLTIFSLLFAWCSFAQVQIGEGTNETQRVPFEPYYGYSYTQSIYLSSEINATGEIISLQWFYSGTSALPDSQDLTIYLGETTKNTFESSSDWEDISNLTQVYNGGITVSAGSDGWVTLTFDTPFNYTGVGNLIVAVDENTASYDESGDDFHNTDVGSQRSIGFYSDGTNPDPASPPTTGFSFFTSNYVPNIIFDGITQTCPTLSDLSADNVTTTSADLTWTAGGTETEWEILYGEAGFDLETEGTTISDNDGTLGESLSGLSSDTDYEVYVKSICSASDESAYVGPSGFTTLVSCPDPSEIYTTNVTSISAEVYWLAGLSETEWEILYGETGFDPETEGTTISDNDGTLGVELTGLMPQTQYDVYVKGVCDIDDESNWVGPYTFGDYAALEVTGGFNEDVIANGVGDPSTTTTSLVDDDSYAYLSEDYQFSASDEPAGFGLPIDGNLSEGPTEGLNFQMADYSSNNSLRIPTAGEENGGTLIFDNSQTANNLYIMATSGSGSSVMAGTITFDDDTTQEIPNTDIPDWYGGPANMTIISGLGRVNVTDGNAASNSSNPRIYQLEVSVDPSNYDKVISSVNLYKESGDGIINVFGASIQFAPDCAEPTDLTVDNITSDSADITWTAGNTETEWEVLYGDAGFDAETEGTSIADDDGELGVTIADLSAITEYDVYVKAICGTDDESIWIGPISFQTECATYIPEYVEDFASFIPTCWEEAGSGLPSEGPSDLGTGSWFEEEFLNTGSNNAAAINLYTTGREEWLISPSFDLSADSYELVYTTAVTNYLNSNPSDMGSDDEVQLLISEDNGATWSNLLTYDASNTPSATGQEEIIDLSTYSGTVKFAFWATDGTEDDSEDYDFFVDDFEVRIPPTCPAPVDLLVENITTSSADISWTAGEDETEWEILYEEEGFDPETEGNSLMDDDGEIGEELTDLTSGGVGYDVYVRAICGDDNESVWIGPITFYTNCEAIDTAYAEDFETNLSIPTCWSSINQGTANQWNISSTITGGAYSGSNAAKIVYESATAHDDYLITPLMEIVEETNDKFSFWIKSRSTTFLEPYEVVLSTTGSDSDSSFNVTLQEEETAPAIWTKVEFDLSEYVGETINIAVRATGTNEWELYADDFVFEPLLICEAPTNVIVENVTDSSADISWTAGDDETEWEILYGEADFDPMTQGTSVMDTDGTIGETISPLMANTPYDVYVRAVCGEDDQSDWTAVETFTTEQLPCEVPTNVIVENVTDSSADINWTAGGTETEWEILYGEADFDPMTQGTSVMDTDGTIGETISPLMANTPYDVYVRAICGEDNQSDWTAVETFTTEQLPCEAPTDVVISNVLQTSADISWTASGDETEWEILYGEAEFDPLTDGISVMDTDGIIGETLVELTPETDYDVYVRAICSDDNFSDWTAVQSFTTEDLSIAAEQFEGFEYYPNPVKSTLSLSATFQIEKVVVYNLLGQKVNQLTPNTLTTEVNMDRLSAATYLVSVTIDGQVKTFRVIKE
ncbi:T9SS-dependent choice-of-anchor J family protein [Mesonia aquimarina]|uniref:T9SS-dependent choice-of-anchor J family protein n=1 Tax=Mesonia aquimarina TaxID=1504967 RepID=UPI000EF58A48|nr:choice-of-anchor J domain-containing protein [Mesonia aquimarina]